MTQDTASNQASIPPESIWGRGETQHLGPLTSDVSHGVCVVGAGVSGLCTAFELSCRGHDVVVLEAAAPGGGETTRSTAHLVTALDERYMTIERQRGIEIARAAASAHSGGITWLEALVREQAIACDFARVTGTLVVGRDRASEADTLLSAELAAATRAGVRCERVSSHEVFPGGAILFPDQAQLDPNAFVSGLARVLAERGVRIYARTEAVDCNEEAGGVVVATSAGAAVHAEHVILATHDLPARVAPRVRRLTAHSSFVVALRAPDGTARQTGSLLWDGYWDRGDPYHYVRGARGQSNEARIGSADHDLLLVGGEDIEGREPIGERAAYDRLERWARAHFPQVGERVGAWWGTIMEPEGEFALIGHVPGNQRTLVIAGDSGNGFTYAAIAAQRIASLIDPLHTNPQDPIKEAMYAPSSEPRTQHAMSSRRGSVSV